ncbi:MAG: RIP metalloprotease RseP [Bacteroidales bacterium]|jgi:regulator of sigma E protease|nr:RIP metalloprotease RseP [Bacteroidales bacterium]
MEILIKASQFILSLSFIVIAHELGHFLFAKLFHTRVEKFYLFFDPWFSLFKIKKGDTEYGVGWLPLGGYVKISGMIDESMDTEKMKQPPQPWEFRSKPSWQKLLIMIAGVVINFLAALFIYSMIMYTWGMNYIATKDAVYGYRFCNTAVQHGFRNGDKVVAVDGQHYEVPSDAFNAIIIEDAQTVTVARNDTLIDLRLPVGFAQQCVSERKVFAEINLPGIVIHTVPGSPAEQAGVQPDDRLTAVNDVPVPFFGDLIREVRKNAGQTIRLTLERNEIERELTLTVSQDSTIGVNLQVDPTKILHVTHVEYGFLASFPAGIRYGVDKLVSYVKSMRFLKGGISQVSGFIGIGKLFPSTWNWHGFWDLTALLSIILAFMNILPIPALDGGHVLFLLVEIITRRKPSDKFLERAQIVGMALLIGLLLIANGNDIIRLFFPNH